MTMSSFGDKGPTLNQDKRLELCRRILAGDAGAVAELAELYRQAGYRVLGNLMRQGSLEQAQQHARCIVEAK